MRRKIFPCVLSLILPGAGQIYNGQLLRGIAWIVFVTGWVVFWTYTGFAARPDGLIADFAGQVVIAVLAASDAYRAAGSTVVTAPDAGRPSRLRPLVKALAVLVCVALLDHYLVKSLPVRGYMIPTMSMSPTLQRGDRIIADMRFYRNRSPQPGDVVIIDIPTLHNELLVKRVIAVGGGIVEEKVATIYVNGKLLREPYAAHRVKRSWISEADIRNAYGPATVPPDQFFVLGDNRDNSWDSRSFGMVPRSRILGRAMFIYWSKDWRRIGMRIRRR